MKRISSISLAWSALLVFLAGAAHATPVINGATVETRTFNDCPLSTLTTSNNYPASVQITDVMDPLCVGFANLHSFSFSADGGTTAAVFNNNSNFRFGADVRINGAGEGEGGLRLSPWYGKLVDGRFMANATSGEIACFGGAVPFYSFTGNHGITYTKGTTIHMELTYRANDLDGTHPATIQYRVVYNGNTYDSPELAFGQANPAECDPNGEWGMLNDGRAGGYFQPRANSGASLAATWSNIFFENLPALGTPVANAANVVTRTFNDCPLSTVTASNNYPASVEITDVMDPLCVGFANLHSFSFSDDGGASAADFDNNANMHYSADFRISGAGEGEGGLRLSPWYGQFVDGRFMANATSGEIACFGGAVPFYSFTGNHGITYTRGTTIRLDLIYRGNDNIASDPATIRYRVIYNGNTYDSPELPFGQQNPTECDHGLWGMLNDGRAGGYFQPRANTSASLTATWSNIRYSACADPVAVGFEFRPRKFNQHSHAKWVTANLTPAAPYGPSDIDVSSIRVNGVPVAAGQVHIHSGTLTVKFDRDAFAATQTSGNAVPVVISGVIGSDCFEGTSGIIVGPSSILPADNAVVAAGSVLNLQWDPAEGEGASSLVLVSSSDNGANWRVEAENVANSGLYHWNVPMSAVGSMRLGLAKLEAVDQTGVITDVEVAETGTFQISSPTGVGDGVAVSFALRGATPNPAARSFNAVFSLPSSKPATLALFDISGRQITSRAVGNMGPGLHSLVLGEREALRPGVYLMKLTQDNRIATSRVAILP